MKIDLYHTKNPDKNSNLAMDFKKPLQTKSLKF
jgi:hypothetical protein